MNYTPFEIEKITIKNELFNGYNKAQVNDIIAKANQNITQLLAENEELKNNVTIMKETVQHYKTIEESLQHTLIIAQHTSDTIKDSASEKAQSIVKDAEQKAQNIINDANTQVAKIKIEYDEISKNLNAYRLKSQSLLIWLQEMLKQPFEEKMEL